MAGAVGRWNTTRCPIEHLPKKTPNRILVSHAGGHLAAYHAASRKKKEGKEKILAI